MFAVILAGGENTRFPAPKAFVRLEGKKIIEWQIGAFSMLPFRQTVISANEPEKYFHLGLPLIGDVYPVRGPMTGLFSAFAATGARRLFAVACDMPFIDIRLVRVIIDRMDRTGADAVAPVWKGKAEPLFALYSARCAPLMEKRILEGHTSLQGILSDAGAEYVSEDEVGAVDPGGKSFVNINTLEDLEKARALIAH